MTNPRKTRVRTPKTPETPGDGRDAPIKPKAPASPDSDGEGIQNDRVTGDHTPSPYRHKPKAAVESSTHAQGA